VHNNYYFLRQLSTQLRHELAGFTLVSCFSQNKDELIIEFNNASRSYLMKASLLPQFCCLSFPEDFNRARRNSIDLFNEILMRKVIGVRQFDNERSFSIELEESYELLFKMHGNRSNLILFQNKKAIALFRNHLESDLEISLDELDRSIDFSKEAFELNITKLPQLYYTFGKLVWEYWKSKEFDKLSINDQWNELVDLRKQLENPSYFIIKHNGSISLSLLPFDHKVRSHETPITAINEFFLTASVSNTLQSEKSILQKQIHDSIKSSKNYVKKNQQKLDELVNDQHYQIWADLIMAHMHEIKLGTEKITLTSFYDGQPVEIKLKRDLNPQKNAEIFYRKAKNQQIEINKLKDSIHTKQQEINTLLENLNSIESTDDLKTLRKSNPQSKSTKEQSKSLPYYEFEFKGFKIWVGKNAEHNDELTLKNSYKEDVWLHAKDVAGSHVLIKHQSGKNFPKDVIERAAQLAAYNSKRKTESLCPVIVTPKKFVRKRKGDPKGMVVVERETVIMVEPKLDA
jgi:predicted ribosome quality control (RQC) complex YloA/Tae2 family protein